MEYQKFNDQKDQRLLGRDSKQKGGSGPGMFAHPEEVRRDSDCQSIVDHLELKVQAHIADMQWHFFRIFHPQQAARRLAAANQFLVSLKGVTDLSAIHVLVESVGDDVLRKVLKGFLDEKGAGKTMYRAPVQ